MGALNDNAIYAARPAIVVDGRENADLAAGLMSLAVSEDVNGVYRCEAEFGNWGARQGGLGFLYFDRAMLDFGKPLVIRLAGETLFDGRITALEGVFPEGQPPRLAVLAEDRLQDLRMTRRTRSFADMSDADVAQRIAQDHGLTPQVQLSGPTHKLLAQVNQSDLAFLRERARLMGGELWVEGSTLNLKPRSGRAGGGAPFKLTWGAELREFSVLADLAHQRSKLTVGGWDVAGKQAIKEDADDAAISGELDGGDGGPSILQSALGARAEVLSHLAPRSSDEAHAQAEALFRLMARCFVVGRGTAQADSRMRVGARVELQGLGPLFNGKYTLVAVRHLFDLVRGIRSEFTAERAALGKP